MKEFRLVLELHSPVCDDRARATSSPIPMLRGVHRYIIENPWHGKEQMFAAVDNQRDSVVAFPCESEGEAFDALLDSDRSEFIEVDPNGLAWEP